MKGKKFKYFVSCFMMFLLAIQVLFSSQKFYAEEIAENSVESCDLNDVTNWISGDYSAKTGTFYETASRVCLADYKSVNAGSSYMITISSNRIHMLIRELDENMQFVKSNNLKNGDTFDVDSKTYYLGISIYDIGSSTLVQSDYEELFENGLTLSMNKQEVQEDEEDSNQVDESEVTVDNNQSEETDDNTIENCNLNEFSNWISGDYSAKNGNYYSMDSRICIKEYKTAEANANYNVSISNAGYRLLIRELDENKQFIKSNNLKNGEIFSSSATTAYLAISIYNVGNDKLTLADYQTLFENGFTLSLQREVNESESEEVTGTTTSDPDSVEVSDSVAAPPAATLTPTEALREEMKEMILTGDATVHDISSYKFTYSQVDAIWNDLVKTDCKIANACYGFAYLKNTKDSSGLMQTISIANTDTGFAERYAKTQQVMADLVAEAESKNMTDLDKVIFVHDYIVKNTTYKNSGFIAHCAGAVLGEGYGVCEGYTNALNLVLEQMGITTVYVSSNSMNHAWSYVSLDGEWYNVDATWDDTRSQSSGKVSHKYFLRSDKEFNSLNHYSYTTSSGTESATSTIYSSWFVHDIVGDMLFDNGCWYYVSNGCIMKSKSAAGSTAVTVVDGDGATLVLKEVKDGAVTYTADGVETTLIDETEVPLGVMQDTRASWILLGMFGLGVLAMILKKKQISKI